MLWENEWNIRNKFQMNGADLYILIETVKLWLID